MVETGERIVRYAPPLFLFNKAGERVHDCVEIRRYMQPVKDCVVARIDYGGKLVWAGDDVGGVGNTQCKGEPPDKLGSADASCEGHYAHRRDRLPVPQKEQFKQLGGGRRWMDFLIDFLGSAAGRQALM